MSHDHNEFDYAIKKILDANQINYESINMLRSTEYTGFVPILEFCRHVWPDEKIIKKIHQRLGRSAMCCGLWENVPHEKLPCHDEEWFRYVCFTIISLRQFPDSALQPYVSLEN